MITLLAWIPTFDFSCVFQSAPARSEYRDRMLQIFPGPVIECFCIDSFLVEVKLLPLLLSEHLHDISSLGVSRSGFDTNKNCTGETDALHTPGESYISINQIQVTKCVLKGTYIRAIYVKVIITEALPYAQPCVKLLIFS